MEKKLIATRDGLGDELVELGGKNKNIYVVDADIGKSCKTTKFAKTFPEQHVNVGIAEQNAAGLAAGLATCGKIPFVVTYAVFGSLRMCEQIRQEICYPKLNVKIACSHSEGADIIFLAFGNAPVVESASKCTKEGGVISEIAVIPNGTGCPYNMIQVKQQSLIGSNMYVRKDYEVVVENMAKGRIDSKKMVSKIYPIEEFTAAMEMADKRTEPVVKVMLKF